MNQIDKLPQLFQYEMQITNDLNHSESNIHKRNDTLICLEKANDTSNRRKVNNHIQKKSKSSSNKELLIIGKRFTPDCKSEITSFDSVNSNHIHLNKSDDYQIIVNETKNPISNQNEEKF